MRRARERAFSPSSSGNKHFSFLRARCAPLSPARGFPVSSRSLRSAQSRTRVPSFFALAALPPSLRLRRDKPLSPHTLVSRTYCCKNYLSSLLLQRSKQVTGNPRLILFSNKKMARFGSPYHIYTSIKLYILVRDLNSASPSIYNNILTSLRSQPRTLWKIQGLPSSTKVMGQCEKM